MSGTIQKRQVWVGGVALALLAGPALADVPRIISYQGRLVGYGSDPVTLGVQMWDSPVGGVQMWPTPSGSELHNVTLAAGIFSIFVGSASVPPGVPDTAFDADQLWLQLSVNGTVLSPRTQIGMVPFAAKATSAEQLVRPGTFTPARDHRLTRAASIALS